MTHGHRKFHGRGRDGKRGRRAALVLGFVRYFRLSRRLHALDGEACGARGHQSWRRDVRPNAARSNGKFIDTTEPALATRKRNVHGHQHPHSGSAKLWFPRPRRRRKRFRRAITTTTGNGRPTWRFLHGTVRPTKVQMLQSKSGLRPLQVWPKEKIEGDRVEEQLMFVPPHYEYNNAPLKSILLYNSINDWMVESGQNEFISKNCPVNRCTITTNKSKISNVDSILFRNEFSHPGRIKTNEQIWILFRVQSAYYTTLNLNHDLIDWTATYRHDSDIVTPYQRWAYYDPLVTQVEQFHRNYAQSKTKQVAMIVSNCNTDQHNRRGLNYAKELSKYISVDVYSECDDFMTIKSDTILQMLDQDYKFYLAFENSNCIDYVTETFFVNGLQHDVLPVVMGARREDYERLAPERSYLHVDDYESAEGLAEHLRRLDEDDALYNEYFRWKGSGEFIDTKFFCRLCAMLHDDGAPAKRYRNLDRWWRGPGVCDDRGAGDIPTQLAPPPTMHNDIEDSLP